jgi:hypothetical protein
MINLSIFILAISIFSLLYKRSLINTILNMKALFLSLVILLLSINKEGFEALATIIYLVGFVVLVYFTTFIKAGREGNEDLDNI